MDNSVNQPVNETSIKGVLHYILRNPFEVAILRWHWKAALFSALFRTPIFIIAYHNKGFGVAAAAATIQFIFRTVTGGINGSIIQSFSRVEPPWHAIITVPVILAAITHVFEYLIQVYFDNYHGTDLANKAIIASVTLSVMTAIFNLFAMRRGVLLVKDEQEKSLWKDFAYIPRLIFDFMMVPSQNIYKKLSQKQFLMAIFIAFCQSLGTGLIAAILRRKEVWGYWTAGIVFGLTVIAVTVIAIVSRNKTEKKFEAIAEYQTD